MLPGYNTNGFAHHRLEDAINILADLGYRSIALTLDYHSLLPSDDCGKKQQIKNSLQRHGLRTPYAQISGLAPARLTKGLSVGTV